MPLCSRSLPIASRIAGALSVLATVAGSAFPATPGLTVGHLRCEYAVEPLNIDSAHPRFSFQESAPGRGQHQTAYEIWVAGSEAALRANRGDLWHTGRVMSDRSTEIEYAGAPLHSGEEAFYKVRVWDRDGRPSPISAPAHFQMGLLKPLDWKAAWITPQTPRDTINGGIVLPPSPYLRHVFVLNKPLRHATLYVTARGLYEMHLNGARVGDALLAPGWTDYNKHIQYQAYDVTRDLHHGANAVGAILGDGWYSGYVGFARQRNNYGSQTQLLAQINVEYADGSRQTVGTDSSWQAGVGPIAYSDMLQGERYDARKELTGWDTAGFRATGWQPVTTANHELPEGQVDITRKVRAMVVNNAVSVVSGNDLAGDPAYGSVKQLRIDYAVGGKIHSVVADEKATVTIPAPGEGSGPITIRRAVYGALNRAASGPIALVGAHDPPIRVTEEMHPVHTTKLASGAYLLDLGQNMVGWARLKVHAPAGTEIGMRFGEILNPDGTLYTANLRSARATDTYICRGGGIETWEPHFTFHGFRYIEVRGLSAPPTPGMITGRVVGSDTPAAGTFACSSPLVNQLQHNIVWGQRGNLISVPTDCPQRDERLGWMGDAQIFVRTATYNRDVASFYEKWMQDVEDGQSKAGGFSDVSPRIVDLADGAPAWGDAGVIVPWTIYQAYGDTTILRRRWAAMNRWLDYITSANPNGLWINRRNNDFGDWLSIAADTPKDVLATAYYAYDASLMAQMARAIGERADAARYDALFERIKTAFNTAFVAPDGRIKGNTQTAYVVALRFGLLPESLRAPAAQYLVDDIAAKKNHLSTGFVGVGYLCPVLTATGHNDVAYQLLQQDTFPSWGYSIRQGATTIWERWDGYTKEKGFQDPGMNSFNHYSLGSVGQWMYQTVAGIDTDPNQPGYKHILLHPRPGPGLSYARATYESRYGLISSGWKIADGRLTWDVTVPTNATATVWVPTSSTSSVTESGRTPAAKSGVALLRTEPGFAVYAVGSGNYHFTAAAPK
jgi:alpha-L-rhamnosidase